MTICCPLTDIVRAHDARERKLRAEFNASIAHLTPQRQVELKAQRKKHK